MRERGLRVSEGALHSERDQALKSTNEARTREAQCSQIRERSAPGSSCNTDLETCYLVATIQLYCTYSEYGHVDMEMRGAEGANAPLLTCTLHMYS